MQCSAVSAAAAKQASAGPHPLRLCQAGVERGDLWDSGVFKSDAGFETMVSREHVLPGTCARSASAVASASEASATSARSACRPTSCAAASSSRTLRGHV